MITKHNVAATLVGTTNINNYNYIDTSVLYIDFEPSVFDNKPYRLAWDNDNGTLSFGLPDGGSIQINQEEFNFFHNLSGVTLVDGDIVCVIGATGNRLAVTLTNASNPLSSQRCIGVVTNGPIAPNNLARVTMLGMVNNLNTSAYNEGDVIYADPSNNGKWTSIKPSYPNMTIRVGTIMVKHATVGVLAVRIQTIVNDYVPITGGTFDGSIRFDSSIFFKSNAIWQDTVWDDLMMPLTTGIKGSADKPDYDFVNNGYLFPQNDATEKIYLIGQLPHSYKLGSNISPHLHWEQANSNKMRWFLSYKWVTIGDDSSIAWTTLESSTNTVITYTSGKIHQISEFPDIVGTDKGLSSIFLCSLWRNDTLTTGRLGNDALAWQFDVHYEKDTLGSNSEYIK